MRLACASICYRGYAEDEIAETLVRAPAIGYRCMEIHGPAVWSAEAVRAFDFAAVAGAIGASGMECVGIYTPGWGGADAVDTAARAEAIATCAGHVHALGGHHVTSSGAQPRTEPGALDRVADCIEQVLDLVPANSPVRLCLEPHFGNVLQQPEDFRRLLDRFEDHRLGVCVDTGHFHSAGVDTPSLIRQFAPRIYNVHLKDHLGTSSVGIGRGEIDLRGIVDALREVRYQHHLTVELEVEDTHNLPRYTEEAYVYISGLLGVKL